MQSRRSIVARSVVLAVGLLAAPSAGRSQECCAVFEPGPLPPLSTNQVVHVPVKVTNTGDVTWVGGVGSTDWILSYLILRPSGSWVAFGPPALFPRSVAKGESATVSVRLQAPKTAGSYIVRWFVGTTLPTPGSYYWGSTTFDQTVDVTQSLLYLKALLSVLAGTPPPPADPRTAVDLSPVIESVAGRSATEVTSWVTVGGRRFDGAAVGQLALNFEDGVESIYPDYWTDREAMGLFRIQGRVDQPATLQLIRSDGVKSNEWPVLFRAGLDYSALDPRLAQIECASAGHTTDECRVGGYGKQGYFAGSHSSHCCVSGDSGTDTYTLPTLLNGWYYEWLLFKQHGYPDEASASYSGFTPGPGGHTVSVSWSAPLHGDIQYTFQVFVRGPIGVPYR